VAADAAKAESANFTVVIDDDVGWAAVDAADAPGMLVARRAQTGRNITATRAPSRQRLRIFFTVFSFCFFAVFSLPVKPQTADPTRPRARPSGRAAQDAGYAHGSFLSVDAPAVRLLQT
jgi:hypothetical protein